jgi:2-methylaconitate cis-trans-isomerase PrpF
VRIEVKRVSLAIAAAISVAGGTAAFAAELPTYEVTGFPISPVQLRLLGPANVQERSTTPTGMAAPHQADVLTGRPGVTTGTIAPTRTGTTGLAVR